MFASLISRIWHRSARRSLEAAGGGRRWADDRRITSAGGFQAGAGVVAARAQAAVANNPTLTRIVASLEADLIGTGIKPRALVEDEVVRSRLHRRVKAWTDTADVGGLSDFFGVQALLVRDMIVAGEGLAVWTADPATGAPQLSRLAAEQLDRSLFRPTDGGGYIHQGVEFDRNGRRVAYHIRPGNPADPRGLIQLAAERIPASDVIHLFRPLMPGQVRGVSWLAPILLGAAELDGLLDAMAVRARVSALFAGLVVSPDGTPLLEGEQNGSTSEAAMEPGALVNLPPGSDVRFPAMPDQGGVAELMNAMFRRLAAGAGVTAEAATGDYSEVNYSSARAAQAEHRRWIETIQHHVIVPQLCAPTWRRFMRWEVLAGGVSAAAYSGNRATFEAADWITAGWVAIDPVKSANADIAMVATGLKSRAEAAAERGVDVEDLDRQLAADAARLGRLGVALPPTKKDARP